MKNEEKLVLYSCMIKKTVKEKEAIDSAFNDKINWIEVAGILMNHRLGGYFYKGLDASQRKRIPKELRKNLEILVWGMQTNQKLLNPYIDELREKLETVELRYAGLKGILFGAALYEEGIRRSNDLDLLVYEKDLDILDVCLRELGYIQTFLPNGELIEATKKEKIIQRLNYHDLVPYMKMVDGRIIEVDINFLFDGKENLIDEKVFDMGTQIYDVKQYRFRGLDLYCNIAFLITHFYREATEELWVKNSRNFTLYKIVDIVNFYRQYEDKIDINELIDCLKNLNLLKKTAYTMNVVKKFYENDFGSKLLEEIYVIDTSIRNEYENKEDYDDFFSDSFCLGNEHSYKEEK